MTSSIETFARADDPAPRSATPFSVGLLGMLAGLLTLWLVRDSTALDGATRSTVACLAIIATVGAYELLVARVYLRPSAGLTRRALRSLNIARVAMRLASLACIYAGIGALYWLLPEYHGSFYHPFWSLIGTLAPYVAVAAPFYFAWMDTHQRETDDAYLLLARLLLRGERPSNWRPLREMLAGWMVKAFFLPLMTVYLSTNAAQLNASLSAALNAPFSLATFRFMYDLSFAMDLMFGTVGYLCTLRILDSHVRSAEPTTLGWLVALICYQPFWSLISSQYIRYEGSMFWDNWLISMPVLRIVWGSVIVALLLCYACATMSFGLRFSNLTNRGIITSGPYRLTKHPAYIAKNLSYWMVSVPFIEPLGWQVALMHCAALLAVNLVYFVRAKTEEKHLMNDPDYRAYAEWIARNGVFAKITRAFR
ncbi:isoprenylcysteine carboxylmethyltransferase family protein [Paraburkholderia graminis]|jgi:protein-S-isoprenylcysteine O-methyltransferase Ste14|uniref:Protein-S-isoprenylcysteine O-methyltransferase Ste14 n=1 Tax=Paraburkholderia graminis TaxID=60548 RepID=A0ABD5CMB6_9BURK|nr:isoprenylcysteine carboxylmethyltransferase family protein [Paraburkholderia graminis]MDR6205057.1 protein-S-isoprenylcysteine O-methyltransferase Ste14 [Paraburkholderia graminis]